MAGKKITRLREALKEAVDVYEKAKGTADEPFAFNRVGSLKAELALEEGHRAKFGKHPREKSVWSKEAPRKSRRKRVRAGKVREAAGLVGAQALGNPRFDGLEIQAGLLAAEIAVEGVPPDFAAPCRGAVSPLTDREFGNARDILAAVSSAEGETRLLSDASATRERWLAEAFPSLPSERRVKCARFLSGMATLAAEKPSDESPNGATVIEAALKDAGMTYVEFEQARSSDVRFNAAQEAVRSARKRCIMDRLEETLQNRALFGQMEETVDRFGGRNMVRRIDNRLAFDMLKHGHERYLKQNIEDKAKATAMTLMIAQGAYPEAPKMKEAEVIDVK